MSEVVKKPLKITETVLRDAHQSLIATRMTTEQMLPIVDKMDKVGYNAVECWGGATFDACLRFLKEDPWDRLRKLRDGFKNTKLQMLFRGQNILGYRPYADDVVEYFVQKSIANGIDIIRIFDCLNDIRNLQTAVTACNKEKGHAQVALSYTLGDAYTLDYWMDMAKRVEDMGADSLCIKDMAGLLVPAKATELVQALKDSTSLPVELHTHYTSGVASMTYMKAIETVDECVGKAVQAVKDVDGVLFICADHGNAEQMIDYTTGQPHTAHTTNPVPFILVNYDPAYTLKEGGCLADIVPTLLNVMGMEQPAEMTGKSLLIKK